jgi:hypothetical protein
MAATSLLERMGYNLYITRASYWAANEGAEITASEWLTLVDADPELTLAPEAGLGSYFARWRGPSRHAEPWLDWAAGNVYTKYPDSALLRKMVSLAEQLGAEVQGEEGERYTGSEPLDAYLGLAEPTAPERQRPEPASPEPPAARPKAWWRRLVD